MKTFHSNLMEEAMHDYDTAREELNRPEHDVVTHSVCHLTRKSICSLLRAYLSSKDIPVSENETMEKLVVLSKQANPSLSNFDFSILACSCLTLEDRPDNYCLSKEKVGECFLLLDSLKNFLFDDMRVNAVK